MVLENTEGISGIILLLDVLLFLYYGLISKRILYDMRC